MQLFNLYKKSILSLLVFSTWSLIGYEGGDVLEKEAQIQVSGRALVVKDQKLLLVGHSSEYWYTPGGRLEIGESLSNCIVREVFEETGLKVKTGRLVHVFEFYDTAEGVHKVECYFLASVEEGELKPDWEDIGGEVKYKNFFSLNEIKQKKNVFPQFLNKGYWLDEDEVINKIYQGLEIKK